MARKRPVQRGKDPKPKRQIKCSIIYKGEEYSSPNPVPEELLCPICRDLLDEPQQTTDCGHIFCKKCLVALVQGNQSHGDGSQTVSVVMAGTLHQQPLKCPTCRTSCEGWFEDKNVNHKVRNVEVFCSNPSCEWKGSLCQLDDHKVGRGPEGCQYEPVSCTLGCGVKMIREYLDNHKQNTYALRPKTCEYCQLSGTYKSMNTHHSECQKYPIPCPNNCGKKNIPVQEVEGHLQECPEQVIKCSYSDLGCQSIFKRRTSEDHYKTSKGTHMYLLLSRVTLLTQAFIKMRRRGTASVASAQIDPLLLVNRPWLENTKLFPSMPWIICFNDYNRMKTQHQRYTSTKEMYNPFFTGPTGYMICLEICPGGDTEESANYVSVFTKLKRGPNDDILSWPFDKTVKVSLLNQLEDSCHYSVLIDFKHANPEVTRIKLGSESATGWGHTKFISHGYLEKKQSQNCQYLRDDSLFFKIELQ